MIKWSQKGHSHGHMMYLPDKYIML